MADGKMPPFLKKKLGVSGSSSESAESESASESSDSASDSPSADAKKKLGPLAAWAKKKAG